MFLSCQVQSMPATISHSGSPLPTDPACLTLLAVHAEVRAGKRYVLMCILLVPCLGLGPHCC